MKKVLVDADALVALAKEDDTNHQKAQSLAQKHKTDNLYITCFTISEAATVLSYKVTHKAAKQFLKDVRKRKLIELPLTIRIRNITDKIFLSQNIKGISWIDCLNVAMVKANKLDAIFSFDKFYKKMGIKTLNL